MPKAVALSDYNAGSDQEISFKVCAHSITLHQQQGAHQEEVTFVSSVYPLVLMTYLYLQLT